MSARATDPDGSVSFVEFFANSMNLGQVVSATDVTLRVSAATGERLVVPRPAAAAVDVPDDVSVGGRIHEEVGGRKAT